MLLVKRNLVIKITNTQPTNQLAPSQQQKNAPTVLKADNEDTSTKPIVSF